MTKSYASLLLAISCLLFSSCLLNFGPQVEDRKPLPYNNKIAYTISTFSINWYEVCVSIHADQETANPAYFQVNGKGPDYDNEQSGEDYYQPPTDYGFYQYLKAGDTVTFSMVRDDSLGSDSLSGKFVIPGTVDSLFCNNTYVPPLHGYAVYQNINSPSPFVFRWKSAQTGHFSVSFWGGEFYPWVREITHDSTMTLRAKAPFDSGNCKTEFSVSVYAGNDSSAADTPMVKSKTMSVFYELNGPEYEGCVSFPYNH